MADNGAHNGAPMYCHGCHYQWQRQGGSIECPSCHSASTEIVTPDNDPNHFYNRQSEQQTASETAAPTPPAPQPAPQTEQSSDQNTENSSSNAEQPSGHGPIPHPTVQFTIFNVPFSGMTFFTTSRPVAHPAPAQPAGQAEQQEQQTEQPPSAPTVQMPPIIHFSFPIIMHGLPLHRPQTAEAPQQTETQQPESQQADGQAQQTAGEQHFNSEQQQNTGEQQLPSPQQPSPEQDRRRMMQANMIESLLSVFFHPANAILGDAVYSQEAFDRIISQLRDQTPVGGAPPASQAAIDKLPLRELEEESKCVVCVEDMPKGEKVAVLPCTHSFHGECVTPWLKLHNTCPVCRRSVEMDESDTIKKGAPVFYGPAPPENDPAHQHQHNGDAMDCS
ncbi:hypothetical protein QBC35DRAFT_121400 [Podospora australis]|uniref:RING-type E3 ubiquitin transferase n=1 Tax=Podospora australis TaxID=1536484 RepID=A0AAN7AJT2_9PEZI|nr:hypothetical protein QBC35DRAFT_121400 [Podospora australis]